VRSFFKSVLLSIGLLSTALAQRYTLTVYDTVEYGRVVDMVSDITMSLEDYQDLELAILRERPHTLRLSSVGGYVEPALEVAGTIERLRLPVVVHGKCHSACTYLLLAAPLRMMEEDADIGFHRPGPGTGSKYFVDGKFPDDVVTVGDLYLQACLARLKLPHEIFKKVAFEPYASIMRLSRAELLQYEIVHKVVQRPTRRR